MFDWIKGKSSKYRKDSGKYNFYIKHEPEYIDSSTTLTLTTYTNTSQNATIPCRYRWSIIKNGLTIEVPEFKGSSFKCQPSDIGSLIQAEVTSNDSQYCGLAVIQFGPVKLDVSLKKQVEQALSTGCATMPVYLTSNGQQKQCQIRLLQDVIKINHAYSQNNYTFDYSIFEPRIQCVSKDSSRIIIVFSQKYQAQLRRFSKKLFQQQYYSKELSNSSRSNQSTTSTQSTKLEIKFMNRNSRDIFLFAMKAFNTKKQLRSSVIINKIQKIDFTNPQIFDYVLQIQNIKGQLVKMDQVVKRAHQEKIKYYNQISKLEKQIQQIILTYTRIVEEKFQNQAELSRDYSMLSQKRDQILSKKYRNLQNQNNHLNSRIQTLSKQIDNIRFKPTPTISAPLVNMGSPQTQKIHFNYQHKYQQQYYNNAFTKKKSLQNDASGIANILDELGQSRISYGSSAKQQNQLKCRLDLAERQKDQLEKKLQMSFHKIDSLQKQLYIQKQQLSNTELHQIQQNSNKKLNNSAIHFTYNHPSSSLQQINFNSYQHNISALIDRQKQIILFENNQLKKNNQLLLIEKKRLIEELKRPINNILETNNNLIFNQAKNNPNYLKTNKKQPSSDNQKELLQTINKRDNQIKLFKIQNQQLKKYNESIKKELQLLKSSNIDTQKLFKRLTQLQQQIDMYRKNADALNRSQHLSIEMDSYNQEQIQMLKQHNQFLTTENQKLAKACQKYMTDAKQTNKLRMEIIKLKQKINQLQIINHSMSVP